MPEITCHQALNEDDIPKDRRLLLIAAPGKVQDANLKPESRCGALEGERLGLRAVRNSLHKPRRAPSRAGSAGWRRGLWRWETPKGNRTKQKGRRTGPLRLEAVICYDSAPQ